MESTSSYYKRRRIEAYSKPVAQIRGNIETVMRLLRLRALASNQDEVRFYDRVLTNHGYRFMTDEQKQATRERQQP